MGQFQFTFDNKEYTVKSRKVAGVLKHRIYCNNNWIPNPPQWLKDKIKEEKDKL